jgi:hypothetical protein
MLRRVWHAKPSGEEPAMRLNLTPTRSLPPTATFDILEARARNRGASALISSDLVGWNYAANMRD